MTQSPTPLFEMLLSLFPTNNDLSVHLWAQSSGAHSDLPDALPSVTVPRREFFRRTVELLQSYGLEIEFFGALKTKFPLRADDVSAALEAYLRPPKRSLGVADEAPETHLEHLGGPAHMSGEIQVSIPLILTLSFGAAVPAA